MVKKMHKKKEKEEKANRPMPVQVKTDELKETLSIIKKMGPEDVVKLKHTYFGYFCAQARDMINALPDPNVAIDRDEKFLKIVGDLQPKLNKAKGNRNLLIFPLAKMMKDASKRIEQLPDAEKALVQIEKMLKIIANFDTQDQPKA